MVCGAFVDVDIDTSPILLVPLMGGVYFRVCLLTDLVGIFRRSVRSPIGCLLAEVARTFVGQVLARDGGCFHTHDITFLWLVPLGQLKNKLASSGFHAVLLMQC